ncbi:MAG: hypothetical protein LBM95_06695 [Lactobacillales bacterium]|jgi:hypothetical protein|nr:hypothetical protein [Lactobacillales bacterium]
MKNKMLLPAGIEVRMHYTKSRAKQNQGMTTKEKQLSRKVRKAMKK